MHLRAKMYGLIMLINQLTKAASHTLGTPRRQNPNVRRIGVTLTNFLLSESPFYTVNSLLNLT